ncbi:MAG: hypothetical protein LKE74_04760 [Prevotella sp.]|jgi:hypothetical protein|nr:hypothetical protein [Prevotella sp.]MCH4017751.1 hypothetical protein [Prevotella sp.]
MHFNATVARLDVMRTFKSIGAKKLNFYNIDIRIPKLRGLLQRICDLLLSLYYLLRIHPHDKVYFQYPFLSPSLLIIATLFKFKNAEIIYLIHDLESVRYSDCNSLNKKDLKVLNSADRLLVHTDKMKQLLQNKGVTSIMVPIQLFDYYSDDSYIEEKVITTSYSHTIAFAGNLSKSQFLKELDHSDIPNQISFNLYGVKPDWNITNPQIDYQGKFSPEHTAMIHAGWGLVWDGNTINTCSGDLGEYLKIISPHKLSLYLAAGIPVIVWKQSAQAELVQNHHLGIVVNTISEIYPILKSITNQEYSCLLRNARKCGNKLRNGAFLKNKVL